jgi:hypothetical protein
MTGWHPFERKNFLDPEDADWHLQTWSWILKHCGGTARLKKSPVVTPTHEFFPPTAFQGETRARHIFEYVKKLAGLSELDCDLIAQSSYPQPAGELVSGRPIYRIQRGTFGEDNGRPIITYDPTQIDKPLLLVSTFAHELAHCRLANIGEAPPGGDAMKEYATDLMTVFLGFGIFGADCAFNFWQGPGGGRTGGPWGWSTSGYLREIDWVYALAVFLNLRGENDSVLEKWLKPSLYSELGAASRNIAANMAQLEGLRAL